MGRAYFRGRNFKSKVNSKGSHQNSLASMGSQKPLGDRGCRTPGQSKEGSSPDNQAA